MQRPATSLLETIIREELSLLQEQDLPKPTAGSIQKFLGLSVDGQFGDNTSKAVADYIYGNDHSVKTVSDLYDRMKKDGLPVGAKTGTIFANNGEMAKSIIKLMTQKKDTWNGPIPNKSGFATTFDPKANRKYQPRSAPRDIQNNPIVTKNIAGDKYVWVEPLKTYVYHLVAAPEFGGRGWPTSTRPVSEYPQDSKLDPNDWGLEKDSDYEKMQNISKHAEDLAANSDPLYKAASDNADFVLDALNDYLPSNLISSELGYFGRVIEYINMIESRAALELVMQRSLNYTSIPKRFWFGQNNFNAESNKGWGGMLPDALNYDNSYFFGTDKRYQNAEQQVTIWLTKLNKFAGESTPQIESDIKNHFKYAKNVLKAIIKSKGKRAKPNLFIPGYGMFAPDAYNDMPDEYKAVIQIGLYILGGPLGKVLSFAIATDRAYTEYSKGQYASAGSILVEQIAFAAIDGAFTLARNLTITKKLTASNRARLLRFSSGSTNIVLNALEKKALAEIMKVVTKQEINKFTRQQLSLQLIKAIRIAGSKFPIARRIQVAVAEGFVSLAYLLKTGVTIALEFGLWDLANYKGQELWDMLYKKLDLGKDAIKQIEKSVTDKYTDSNGNFIAPNEFEEPDDPDKFKL